MPEYDDAILEGLTDTQVCDWFSQEDLEALTGYVLGPGQPRTKFSEDYPVLDSGCFWSPSTTGGAFVSISITSLRLSEELFESEGMEFESLLDEFDQREADRVPGGRYICLDPTCYLRLDLGEVFVQINTITSADAVGSADDVQADIAEQVLARIRDLPGS